VNTIEYDDKNNIWFGGIFGLAVIYASDTTNTPYFIPEFKNQFVMNILFDNWQTLLIGTKKGYYTLSILKS
jgi:hypothetical protein